MHMYCYIRMTEWILICVLSPYPTKDLVMSGGFICSQPAAGKQKFKIYLSNPPDIHIILCWVSD